MGKFGDIAMVAAIGVGAFVMLKMFGGISGFFGGIGEFFGGIFGKDRTLEEKLKSMTEQVGESTERIEAITERVEDIKTSLVAHFQPTLPDYPDEPVAPVYMGPKVVERLKKTGEDIPPYIQPLPSPTPKEIATGIMGTWHTSTLNPLAPPTWSV